MRLLGDAVFMRPARRDAARAHPVVLEHGAKARRQIPPTTGFQLVGRGRQIVAAQDGRHAAERPQRALHAGGQRLKRFAERDRHPRPVAVTEHELKEQVRKRIAGDRHAEVGRMREIDRRLATGHGDLLEEHLGLDAVPRPPVAKAPLQRPRLPRVKLLRVARPQHLQHPLRFEDALEVAPQQRLDVRVATPSPNGSGRVRQSRGCFVADGTGPVSHSRAVRRLIPLAAAAAAWVLPSIRFCLMSRTCASVTIDHRLTQPAGRPDAADLVVAMRQI